MAKREVPKKQYDPGQEKRNEKSHCFIGTGIRCGWMRILLPRLGRRGAEQAPG
ncbi:hypothetical protein KJ903_04295 [Patescibacteria group bacterium]|nr:hypothetical protein [Patescibacteria group bacterium]